MRDAEAQALAWLVDHPEYFARWDAATNPEGRADALADACDAGALDYHAACRVLSCGVAGLSRYLEGLPR